MCYRTTKKVGKITPIHKPSWYIFIMQSDISKDELIEVFKKNIQ
jgi:hypothetical protein